MATYEENLITIRDNLAAKLASLSVSPKPNYSVDGQSFSHADYFRMLNEQLTNANKMIASGAPFELVTEIS